MVVFAFGLLAPGSPDPDDYLRVSLLNGITLVVFSVFAFTVGTRWSIAVGEPINRWLAAERPATEEEQDLALRYPTKLAMISGKIWAGRRGRLHGGQRHLLARARGRRVHRGGARRRDMHSRSAT